MYYYFNRLVLFLLVLKELLVANVILFSKFFIFKIRYIANQLFYKLPLPLREIVYDSGLTTLSTWSYYFIIILSFLKESFYNKLNNYVYFELSGFYKKYFYKLKNLEEIEYNFVSNDLVFTKTSYSGVEWVQEYTFEDDFLDINVNFLVEFSFVWYNLLLLVDYRFFLKNSIDMYSVFTESFITSSKNKYMFNTIHRMNIFRNNNYTGLNILFFNNYSLTNYLGSVINISPQSRRVFFSKSLLSSVILLNFFKNFSIFIYLFKFFKNFTLPVLVGLLFLYYSFFFFKLSFVKILFNWIGLGLFVFWLLSTFNFFVKRYRYAKYTSAIQRFWKRAFMCFWMIEGFLFMIFFYYLLNASSEPYFMYDTYGLYINHLLPIKPFLFNSFLVVLTLNILMFLLINTKYVGLKKNTCLLLLVTLVLLYLLFVESYQFYYLVNFYSEYTWSFSEDEGIWELDFDIPRTRNKNHYITLIIVAKFWHYIFIFASWVFFLMKTLELGRIRYTFLTMNFQNVILFYLMNWLCLYSWLKWVLRRFLDQTYYWFFTSFRPVTLNIIVTDFLNYFFNLVNFNFIFIKSYFNFHFFYLALSSSNIFVQSSFLKFSSLLYLI